MKKFFKKCIDSMKKYYGNIKNHPEPKKFARANLMLAFLLSVGFIIVLYETASFLRAVFMIAMPLLIIDNLVCFFIARKAAKNASKKTN